MDVPNLDACQTVEPCTSIDLFKERRECPGGGHDRNFGGRWFALCVRGRVCAWSREGCIVEVVVRITECSIVETSSWDLRLVLP